MAFAMHSEADPHLVGSERILAKAGTEGLSYRARQAASVSLCKTM